MSGPLTATAEPMGRDQPPAWWRAGVSVCFASLGFFLLFSSAGVSLSLAGLLAFALLRPRALWRTRPWKEPVMAMGLLLLAYIAGHTLWTSGPGAGTARIVNQYHELLLAPLLLALLQDVRQRRVFGCALIVGAVFLAALYWTEKGVPALYPFLSSRRISSGFALAVCAFLVLMHARGRPAPWPARVLSAFLAITVLFAVDSRTGHLVVLALAACAAWLHSPRRWRWPAALASVLLALALALTSSAVNTRLQETLAGSTPSGPAGLTSTGIRIELLRLSIVLARQYALTGAGFANYGTVHEQAARARYTGNPVTEAYLQGDWIHAANPHNEFAMQLVGGGIVALALFLAWLGLAMRFDVHTRRGGMLAGTALAFAVGCLFNSMLMNFVEGHIYMGLLTLLLAGIRGQAQEIAQAAGMTRVLVVATRQIGDVLLTTPLIAAAHERWPQARIDVLGFRGTLGMLRGHPHVNELIETPPRLGWTGLTQLVRRLWRRYDLALITDAGDRAYLMGWVAAPQRCGIIPARSASNWWKKQMLRHVVVSAGDLGRVHVTAEKLSLLGPWLNELKQDAIKVTPPPGAGLPAQVQSQLAPGAVLVHAPSMWPYKQWPIAHFEKLIAALLAQGRQVVLTGSAGARDQQCIAPLRRLGAAPQLLDVSGQLDFNQLVTLFESAALYIGPDTSVSHLAAAAGVPVIAILGPTNPMRWAPWPARSPGTTPFALRSLEQHAGNVTVLQSGLACVPCGRAGCEDHRQSRSDCLIDITPERVLAQAMKVLNPATVTRP